MQRIGIKDTMRYHASQFRAARAALGMRTRGVAAELNWSLRTLDEIEHADEEGSRQPSDAAVAKLVAFYEGLGVTFLTNNAQGVGVRLKTG